MDKYLDLTKEFERVAVILTVVDVLETVSKSLKKTEGIGIQRKNRDHSDHNSVKIG